MDTSSEPILRDQLLDRRRRLQAAVQDIGEAPDLVRLLQEVDSALGRMDARSYGRCEVCEESVETSFLLANPLIQYCLCNLSPHQQQELQSDLDMAARIQWALLPRQDETFAGWDAHYRYEPVGPVSGDFCDLIEGQNDHRELFILVGDVSGKGVSAALVMAHLNAMFRSLIPTGLSLQDLVERANRLLVESTIESHYATLVCARGNANGEIEICNAGHVPPFVIRAGEVTRVGSTGFPVGLRGSSAYETQTVALGKGDTLVLYTDGVTEALDGNDQEYGAPRLARLLQANAALSPGHLAAVCLKDLAAFQAGRPRLDDLTLMVVRRAE